MLTLELFEGYWAPPVVVANFFVLLHLVGALLLGLMVGYERSYHGRAAGMRTYGLVCMATAALTVIGGYSHFWYGGTNATLMSSGDLSRVMQGVLTGIGFLCAGVIMKEGFNISGLTTAASIWAVAVIGIIVGVGLYAAAIALALLCAICMVWVSRLEAWLPSRQAVAVTLRFHAGEVPQQEHIRAVADAQGYEMASGTVVITLDNGAYVWNFIAVAHNRKSVGPIAQLGSVLAALPGVAGFQVAYARN